MNCIRWFRLQYPQYRAYLFAVPNGGKRNLKTAQIMKAEGQLAGVSDLLLLLPRGGYHALCIEMKTETGRLSTLQRRWQEAVSGENYKCIVCRSVTEFAMEVSDYLSKGVTLGGMVLPSAYFSD